MRGRDGYIGPSSPVAVQWPEQGCLLIDTIIYDVEIVALEIECEQMLLEGKATGSYSRKHVFIYEMESSFLRRRAFPLTCLNEAAILFIRIPSLDRFTKHSGLNWQAHSLFSPRSPRCRQWIMILLDVKVQNVARRKVLATLRTSIDMGLAIMDLIVFVRRKREDFPMRWEGTLHDLGDWGGVSMGDLGAVQRCRSAR